jgi:hypothetical protein
MHILVAIPTTMSLARVLNHFKGYSAFRLQRGIFWQKGYYAKVIQPSEIKYVYQYIRYQYQHHSCNEGIISELERKNEWTNELIGSGEELVPNPDQLLIESHRIEDVPGTHTVIYSSEVDEIEFKHKAHSRAGFALGAVMAAEWLEDKTGFFNITDMFDFSI